MGHKVNPIGLRVAVSLKKTADFKKELETFDGWNNIYCTSNNKNNYNKNLHENLQIEKFITDYLTKWGFFINKISISRTSLKINVFVSAYNNNKGNTGKIKMLKSKRGFFEAYPGQLTTLENVISKTIANNLKVKINIIDLNKNLKNTEAFINNFKKSVKGAPKKPYAMDFAKVALLSINKPVAPLVAKVLSNALEENNKHQNVIDFLEETFKWTVENYQSKNAKFNLKGFLIQVKGRINGSDRSRKSIIRYGSLPLHTISESLDYHCKDTLTPYGMCSVKVWLCYNKKKLKQNATTSST